MAKGDPLSRGYTDAAAVTPGAGELPDGPTRGLVVGVSGTVTVTFRGGAAGVVLQMNAGEPQPYEVTHVTAATATGIVALY